MVLGLNVLRGTKDFNENDWDRYDELMITIANLMSNDLTDLEEYQDIICKALGENYLKNQYMLEWDNDKSIICVQFLKEVLIDAIDDESYTMLYHPIVDILHDCYYKG